MAIDRPIFIVAPPRCGTTLLYQCLVAHPDVGYFNRANRNWVDSPRLAHWITKVGGLLGTYRDTPRESRSIWFRFFPERAVDVADARDATPEARAWFEERIEAVLRLRGAKRYSNKLPAHSLQVDFLAALWPDALFLQPLRDWRAVVASTMVKRERDFTGQWFGVRALGWQEQAKRPAHLAAAWHHRVVHEELARQAAARPGRFLPVQYEELLAAPQETMRRVFDFCGLPHDAALLAKATAGVRPTSDKWRETLTPPLLAEIEREQGDAMRAYEWRSSASSAATAAAAP
ncbi:MAG: sulfotransferase [Planctomycetes bacterium]|nr:sulfotransferase [Planctomycetota bacterium]